jgi:hypothetical protein
LIRQMSIDKPLWSAPRIHGELLKPWIAITQSSVAKLHGQALCCATPIACHGYSRKAHRTSVILAVL